MRKIIFLLLAGILSSATAFSSELISKSAEGAKVYFITPSNGQLVGEEFNVKFGLSGMGVAPAGNNVEHTGHHHLLINTDISTIDLTRPLPSSDQVKHFGGGQTEAILKLPKGTHTLQLLLGNYAHVPHDKPVMSEKITITIE